MLILVSLCFAGAFGIESGAPLSALDHPVPTKTPNTYTVATVPMPNSAFVGYAVVATDDGRVCKVLGFGQPYRGDLDGSQVRGAFTALVTRLESRYGPAKTYDFLHAGSIWSEPGDFAMGLYLEQRSLAALWEVPLPEDLSGVMLQAIGLASTTTTLTISYEFNNFKAYAERKRRADDAGL